MVKIFDIEVTSTDLIGRILAGSIATIVTIILLVVPPMIATSFSGPAFVIKSVDSIIRQIVNPFVTILGIIVAILVLMSILLRRSRLEGPLLIGLGLSTLLYFYTLTTGGLTRIIITPELLDLSKITEIPLNITAVISLNSVSLLILLAITSVLILLKGILLIKRGRSE